MIKTITMIIVTIIVMIQLLEGSTSISVNKRQQKSEAYHNVSYKSTTI